jgi:hypothetical protein
MSETVAVKCSDSVPGVPALAAETVSGPLHVSTWPEMPGSEVVAPVVDPPT